MLQNGIKNSEFLERHNTKWVDFTQDSYGWGAFLNTEMTLRDEENL